MRAVGLRTAALLVVALLVTGCTAGAPEEEGADAAPAPSAEASTDPVPAPPGRDACVEGTWSADIQGLIDQLATQLSSAGLAVTDSQASGSQTLTIGSDGRLQFDADMTFVLTVDLGTGLPMTMAQAHRGTLHADWAWEGPSSPDGGTIAFSDFDNSGYTIETSVEVDGRSAASPVEPPSTAAANVPTDVTCADDVLTTHPQGTPFTTTWSRTG
jgi:hypothetical protein